jgi:hypothetical protein
LEGLRSFGEQLRVVRARGGRGGERGRVSLWSRLVTRFRKRSGTSLQKSSRFVHSETRIWMIGGTFWNVDFVQLEYASRQLTIAPPSTSLEGTAIRFRISCATK